VSASASSAEQRSVEQRRRARVPKPKRKKKHVMRHARNVEPTGKILGASDAAAPAAWATRKKKTKLSAHGEAELKRRKALARSARSILIDVERTRKRLGMAKPSEDIVTPTSSPKLRKGWQHTLGQLRRAEASSDRPRPIVEVEQSLASPLFKGIDKDFDLL
jgi:hypothetical protein